MNRYEGMMLYILTSIDIVYDEGEIKFRKYVLAVF